MAISKGTMFDPELVKDLIKKVKGNFYSGDCCSIDGVYSADSRTDSCGGATIL